jgi:hypothetical protein
VLEGQIGAGYPGVPVSDLYMADTSYDGRHQYCWAHLSRDGDELVAQLPTGAAVPGWADGVHAIYQRATADGATPGSAPSIRRQQLQRYEAAPQRGVPRLWGWLRPRNGSCANASPCI